MTLTADDRLAIHEVLALHGHLCDARAYDRFDLVFAPDLEVDVGDLGRAPVPPGDPGRTSLENYIAVAHRMGPGDTVSFHVSNIVVRAHGDGALAWSKALTLSRDGTVTAYTYTDRLVRTHDGWRIRHRRVSPRREPGRGIEPLTVPE